MVSPKPNVPPDLPPLFPPVAVLRAGVVLVTFLIVTVLAMPWQMLLLRLAPAAARRFPGAYHRLVARLFGVRIHVVGHPVTGEGVLLLANHTSWMDIVLFSAVTPLSFVAKAEIAGWPFFGTLARLQRTVFVARERRALEIDARVGIGRKQAMAGDLFDRRQQRLHQGVRHSHAIGGIALLDLTVAETQAVVGQHDLIFGADQRAGLRRDEVAANGHAVTREVRHFGHLTLGKQGELRALRRHRWIGATRGSFLVSNGKLSR